MHILAQKIYNGCGENIKRCFALIRIWLLRELLLVWYITSHKSLWIVNVIRVLKFNFQFSYEAYQNQTNKLTVWCQYLYHFGSQLHNHGWDMINLCKSSPVKHLQLHRPKRGQSHTFSSTKLIRRDIPRGNDFK